MSGRRAGSECPNLGPGRLCVLSCAKTVGLRPAATVESPTARKKSFLVNLSDMSRSPGSLEVLSASMLGWRDLDLVKQLSHTIRWWDSVLLAGGRK